MRKPDDNTIAVNRTRDARLKGVSRPVITHDPALRIIGTEIENAKRQAIGYDLLGMARMLEAQSLGVRDHHMSFYHYFTDKERLGAQAVERLLLKGAGALRRIGNRMTQTRLPE